MTNKLEKVGNELADVSIDVMKWLREAIPQTKDFVVEQAPAVIQEIITRSIAISSLGAILGMAFLVGSVFAFKALIKLRSKRKKCKDLYERGSVSDVEIGMYWLSILPAIIGIFVTFLNIHKLVYVFAAPKLYILEYLKGLL